MCSLFVWSHMPLYDMNFDQHSFLCFHVNGVLLWILSYPKKHPSIAECCLRSGKTSVSCAFTLRWVLFRASQVSHEASCPSWGLLPTSKGILQSGSFCPHCGGVGVLFFCFARFGQCDILGSHADIHPKCRLAFSNVFQAFSVVDHWADPWLRAIISHVPLLVTELHMIVSLRTC